MNLLACRWCGWFTRNPECLECLRTWPVSAENVIRQTMITVLEEHIRRVVPREVQWSPYP